MTSFEAQWRRVCNPKPPVATALQIFDELELDYGKN